MVTCVDENENIVKFFYSKEPDISGLLEGKSIVLTGKVKQHDISKFSQCKETVINVKLILLYAFTIFLNSFFLRDEKMLHTKI